MIVIHTSIPVDPDRREEALEAAETMVERSRNEEGTVSYRATTDIVDPNVIRFFEQYEDETAARAHTGAEYYREFNEKLPALLDGLVETAVFEPDDPPETNRFGAEEMAQHNS